MLIGVAGYARSGKDEVGKALARRGFKVTRFSQALKDEVVVRFPRTLDAIAQLQHDSVIFSAQVRQVPPSVYDDPIAYRRWLVEESKPPGIRELLQEYGTEVRRGDDPEYWTKRWAESLPDGDACVVDVRFPNEVDMIRTLGGKIWRVERPGVGPLHNHASERQDFSTDLTIANDGTLESLDEVVGRLIGR